MKIIITGDIHLRETQPVSRIDNYWEEQWRKITWLQALQLRLNCDIIDAGDLFHKWKPSPYLLSKAIVHLPDDFYTVPGNHDLPQHNIELLKKSGLYVLKEAGIVNLFSQREDIEFVHYGSKPTGEKGADILVWHVMTYQGRKPWPYCKDMSAKGLLKKYPQYKLIITGHNHKPFIEHLDGRMLVNPGSLMRSTADQINHKPRVYVYDGESVYPEYVPIKKNVLTREHIDTVNERNERLEAFVAKLDTSDKTEVSLSFERNLERFLESNKIKAGVKRKVLEACDAD